MMIWWRFVLLVRQIDAMANIGLEPTRLTVRAIMSLRHAAQAVR
jgi:hypothetical protein